jgi:uncharacterized membrane protein YdbT with pleckstrin-like domain
MKYVDQSLGQNEALLYQTHFHPLYYSTAWIISIFFVALAIWSGVFTQEPVDWALLSICAIGLAIVLYLMIPIWTTKIAVTTHRLVIKEGLLFRSAVEVQLRSIEQVSFHQGLLGKLLGFGKISIHGTGVDDLVLPYIGAPTDLVKAIESASIAFEPPAPVRSENPSKRGLPASASS